MNKYPMSWRRWNTELIVIAIVTLLFLGAMIGIAYAVNSEIEECGGVAKCLGGLAGEFDEARRGATK